MEAAVLEEADVAAATGAEVVPCVAAASICCRVFDVTRCRRRRSSNCSMVGTRRGDAEEDNVGGSTSFFFEVLLKAYGLEACLWLRCC